MYHVLPNIRYNRAHAFIISFLLEYILTVYVNYLVHLSSNVNARTIYAYRQNNMY